jgi:hypothetical protein
MATCLAFVPPKIWMRLYTTALCSACIALSFYHMDRTRSSRVLIVLIDQWTCYAIITLNHFSVLTMTIPPPSSNAAGKLTWAYGLLLNPRGIGSGSQKGKSRRFRARTLTTCLLGTVLLPGALLRPLSPLQSSKHSEW